jgi:hypothetical protein
MGTSQVTHLLEPERSIIKGRAVETSLLSRLIKSSLSINPSINNQVNKKTGRDPLPSGFVLSLFPTP